MRTRLVKWLCGRKARQKAQGTAAPRCPATIERVSLAIRNLAETIVGYLLFGDHSLVTELPNENVRGFPVRKPPPGLVLASTRQSAGYRQPNRKPQPRL